MPAALTRFGLGRPPTMARLTALHGSPATRTRAQAMHRPPEPRTQIAGLRWRCREDYQTIQREQTAVASLDSRTPRPPQSASTSAGGAARNHYPLVGPAAVPACVHCAPGRASSNKSVLVPICPTLEAARLLSAACGSSPTRGVACLNSLALTGLLTRAGHAMGGNFFGKGVAVNGWSSVTGRAKRTPSSASLKDGRPSCSTLFTT